MHVLRTIDFHRCTARCNRSTIVAYTRQRSKKKSTVFLKSIWSPRLIFHSRVPASLRGSQSGLTWRYRWRRKIDSMPVLGKPMRTISMKRVGLSRLVTHTLPAFTAMCMHTGCSRARSPPERRHWIPGTCRLMKGRVSATLAISRYHYLRPREYTTATFVNCVVLDLHPTIDIYPTTILSALCFNHGVYTCIHELCTQVLDDVIELFQRAPERPELF